MQALSPTGISRPFDARRDGFVMGEGAGVLVLEEAEAAAARGATILGELAGYGSTSDAYHLTAPEPTGGPAARAIELALRRRRRDPERRRLRQRPRHLDAAQRRRRDRGAQARARRGAGPRIPISSTKSAIGHLLGAAGAVEAVATLQALRTRVDPADARLRGPRPGAATSTTCPARRGRSSPANGGPPVALSNSFAFGGHNVSLALRALADGRPDPGRQAPARSRACITKDSIAFHVAEQAQGRAPRSC